MKHDQETKLNCEVMYDDLALEVRWSVAAESIVLQLVGRIEPGNYMSFGLSGDDSRSSMIGGDVVVAWVDDNGHGHVVDYYLESKAQCAGNRGSCPDTRLQVGNNNVRLLSATVVNGFTMITFQRPLRANDQLDKTIFTNASQPIIFASGPLNQRSEVSYHSIRNREDIFIDFGRSPKWNCPKPDNNEPSTSAPTSASTTTPNYYGTNQNSKNPADEPNPYESKLHNVKTHSHHLQTQQKQQKHPQQLQPVENSISSRWEVPPILCHEPEDRVFYAQMGPTGGKRGYNAITGQVGWGIAWYINGLLIPEIRVVRGRTYTFVVEGGDNPEIPARYHPFYITNDPEGSYQHKSRAEKSRVNVYAGIGVDEQGVEYPTSTGRLCQWTENSNQHPDTFPSYGSYQRSLSLQCDDGNPGILHWTPDKNTPDLVYYQCYTHRYLGWKIHVVDSCDTEVSKGVGIESPLIDLDQEIGESIQNMAVSPHPNDLNRNKQVFTTGRPIERYPTSLHQHQPQIQQQYPHQQHNFHSQQPQYYQQQQIQIHHEENNRPRAPQIIRLNEHQHQVQNNPSLQHYQMRHPVKIQPQDLFNLQRDQPLILSSNGQQNIFKGFSSQQQQQQNHRQQQHPLRHVLPPASSNWGHETQSHNNQPKVLRLSSSGGSPPFFTSTIPSQLAAGSAQSHKIIAIPYHHPSEIASRIPPQHHHHQNQPKRIRQQQQQHGEIEGLKLLNISPPAPIPPIQLHHHMPLRPSSSSNSHNSNSNNNNNNNSRRNPNSWASHQQTRNLLKREEFGKELLKGLDDGSLEIVKLGDNESIPFEIPSQEEIMRNVYNNNDDDQIDESSSQFLHVIKDLSTQKKMMSSSNKSKASYSTQKRVEIKPSGDPSKPVSSHQGDLELEGGPPVQSSFEPIFIPSPPDVSQNQQIPMKTKNKVARTKALQVQRKSLSPSAAVNLRIPHALKQISVNNLNNRRKQEPLDFELPQARFEEEDDEYEDDYYNNRIRKISQLNKRNQPIRRMDSPMVLRKRLGVHSINPPSGIRRDDHIFLPSNPIPLAQIQQHLYQQQQQKHHQSQNNKYRLVDPHNHQFYKRRYYDGQPPHQMVLRQQSTFPSRSGLNHQLAKTRLPNNNLNSKKFQSPLLPLSFGNGNNNREVSTFLRYPETLNQQRDPQRAPNNFPPIQVQTHPHYVRRNFPNTQKNLQSQSQNWRSGDPQLFLVPATVSDELLYIDPNPNSRKESLKNQFPHNLQQREKEFRRVDGEPAGVRHRPLVNPNLDLQQTERRKSVIIRPRIEETLKNSQKSEKSPGRYGGGTTGNSGGGAVREREKEIEQIPSEISDEKVTIRKTQQKQQKVKPIIEENERENRERERSKDTSNNNNTDLHILTDIWSIINNQEEQRGKSPANSNNNNNNNNNNNSKISRFDNPKKKS